MQRTKSDVCQKPRRDAKTPYLIRRIEALASNRSLGMLGSFVMASSSMFPTFLC
jgi:hypothetical protein